MSITFFTTFNKDGFILYGNQWLSTFLKNVVNHNPNVSARIYTENVNVALDHNSVEFLDFGTAIPEHAAWKSQYTESNRHNAGVMLETVRFSHKAFAIQHALETVTTDYAIWLDGDCVFHNDSYLNFPANILDNKFLACQLEINPSGDNHVESGILIFDMAHPHTQEFRKQFCNNYKIENLAQMILPFDGYVVNKTLCQTNLPYLDLNAEFGGTTLVDAAAEKTFLHPAIKNKFTHNIGAAGKASYPNWKKVKHNNPVFENLNRHVNLEK